MGDLVAAIDSNGLRGITHVTQYEENSRSQWRTLAAMRSPQSDFVMLPGDDDILERDGVAKALETIQANPGYSAYSFPARVINEKGEATDRELRPPNISSIQEALGTLLARSCYAFPSTLLRIRDFDLSNLSLTRTAFDWSLWLEAWLKSGVFSGSSHVIKYCQHGGQDSRDFDPLKNDLDASRMLFSVVASREFQDAVRGWTLHDWHEFVAAYGRELVGNERPRRWSPLVGVLIADQLKEIHPALSMSLLTTSMLEMGVGPTRSYLDSTYKTLGECISVTPSPSRLTSPTNLSDFFQRWTSTGYMGDFDQDSMMILEATRLRKLGIFSNRQLRLISPLVRLMSRRGPSRSRNS